MTITEPRDAEVAPAEETPSAPPATGEGDRPRSLPSWAVPAGFAAWVVVVAALTAPWGVLPGAGRPGGPTWLDGSWIAALNMAARAHLGVGSHLIFTYGPYGYLAYTNPFFAAQWLEAAVVTLAVHAGFVASVAGLLRRQRAHPAVAVAAGVLLVVVLRPLVHLDVEGLMLPPLLAALALDLEPRRSASAAGVIAGVVLALMLLVKGTALVVAGASLPVIVAAALLTRRRHVAIAVVAGFAVAFAVLWAGAGLGAGDLPRFVMASYQVASGYSAAMEYGGVTAWMGVGFVVVVLFAAMALLALWRRDAVATTYLVLAAGVLFSAFKDAYVRAGDRDGTFFAEAATLAIAGAVICARNGLTWRPRGVPVLPFAFAPLLLLTLLRWSSLPTVAGVVDPLRSWGTVAHALVDPALRRQVEADEVAAALREYRPVIDAAAIPNGATVDFYGFDAGFFYADHAVVWDPRPTLSSYLAYTPWLDQQDAAFFAGPHAPQYLLYRVLTIDGRYPLGDEPATLQVLMQRYRVVRMVTSQTLLLQLDTAAHTAVPSPAGRACAPIGRPIPVPERPGMLVFGRLEMNLSLPGRLLDVLAKTPETQLLVRTASSMTSYRLVWRVAADGLFLSAPVGDAAALQHAFAGDATPPILDVTVMAGGAQDWQPDACIDYTTLPAAG